MDLATRVQILNKAVCMLNSSNAPGNVWIKQFSVPLVGKTELFNLVMATSLKEGKLWIPTRSGAE